MKFPVLVHKDDTSSYGATLPDIPGCFSGGDTLEETIENIQTAVELFYHGETDITPPQPSPIEDLMASDLHTEGGFWVMVDIDFSFLSPKIVRVNITVPEYKLKQIDRAAKARGLSRSAFLVGSAEEIMNKVSA